MPIWEASEWRGSSHVTRDFDCVVERRGQKQSAFTQSKKSAFCERFSVLNVEKGDTKLDRCSGNNVSLLHPAVTGRGSIPAKSTYHEDMLLLNSTAQNLRNSTEETAEFYSDSSSPAENKQIMKSRPQRNSTGYTVHYFGVANSELGVLSHRKSLAFRRKGCYDDAESLCHTTQHLEEDSDRIFGYRDIKSAAGSLAGAEWTNRGTASDASSPAESSPCRLVTEDPELRFFSSIRSEGWIPSKGFSARGLRQQRVHRGAPERRLHPRTEAASRPLADCLSRESGEETGRGRRTRGRAERAVRTAPCSPASPEAFPPPSPQRGGGQQHRRADAAAAVPEFAKNPNPPIIKPTAAQPTPLHAGGFPGWRALPQLTERSKSPPARGPSSAPGTPHRAGSRFPARRAAVRSPGPCHSPRLRGSSRPNRPPPPGRESSAPQVGSP